MENASASSGHQPVTAAAAQAQLTVAALIFCEEVANRATTVSSRRIAEEGRVKVGAGGVDFTALATGCFVSVTCIDVCRSASSSRPQAAQMAREQECLVHHISSQVKPRSKPPATHSGTLHHLCRRSLGQSSCTLCLPCCSVLVGACRNKQRCPLPSLDCTGSRCMHQCLQRGHTQSGLSPAKASTAWWRLSMQRSAALWK